MFQSFFYWKSASKDEPSQPSNSDNLVSILLLLEIGLKEFFDFQNDLVMHQFQSFFYWKSASKETSAIFAISICRFQSFFYWKSASKVWRLVTDSSPRSSFNPSSIGNRPQSKGYSGGLDGFIQVSILLLLEIGLKDRHNVVFLHLALPVSILLLLEIGLKAAPSPIDIPPCHGFNPSSIGNRPQRIR